MNGKIALLFLVAVAVSAKVEMEYHPQAILHYLELKDPNLAKKVRSVIKQDADFPKPSPSGKPTFRPSGFPSEQEIKDCEDEAIKCHIAAAFDACAHLKCIKRTGCCLYAAGFREHHLPELVKKCLSDIPSCMKGSESCEEKVQCFVKFGKCAKIFGDEQDRK